MDISKLNTTTASNTSKTLRLRNPYTNELLKDGEDYLEIYLMGIGSDVAKNAIAEQKRKSSEGMTDEQASLVGAEFLAKLTTGWSDNIEFGKDKLPYSYDNAVKVYMSEDWIGKQVLEFVTKLKNYDPNA